MISIIVCSKCDDEYFRKFAEHLQSTVGIASEIIRIDNSKNEHSIFSAYNLGASKSTMPYLCFVHEDVRFHTQNWGKKVIEHLEKPQAGIIGIAGSPEVNNFPSPWTWHKKHINIIQGNNKNNPQKKPKHVTIPTKNRKFALPCVLLDGVFLCMKKDLMNQIRFDESFTGFHGYDMDISLQSHTSGYVNHVVYDILLEHFSRGSRDKAYYQNLLKLFRKWKNQLPLYAENYNAEEFRMPKTRKHLFAGRLILKLYSVGFKPKEIMQAYTEFFKK